MSLLFIVVEWVVSPVSDNFHYRIIIIMVLEEGTDVVILT